LEEDRDRIAVLNIEKRALEQLEPISGGPLTAPTAPQMTDVFPNRCGEPNRPFRAGRRSEKWKKGSFRKYWKSCQNLNFQDTLGLDLKKEN